MTSETVRHHDYAPGAFDGADVVIVGPGPGDPRDVDDAKIEAFRAAVDDLLAPRQPFLAVCLGHQVLCGALGLPLAYKDIVFQGTQTQGRHARPDRRTSGSTTRSWPESTTPTPLPDGVTVDTDPETGDVHLLAGPALPRRPVPRRVDPDRERLRPDPRAGARLLTARPSPVGRSAGAERSWPAGGLARRSAWVMAAPRRRQDGQPRTTGDRPDHQARRPHGRVTGLCVARDAPVLARAAAPAGAGDQGGRRPRHSVRPASSSVLMDDISMDLLPYDGSARTMARHRRVVPPRLRRRLPLLRLSGPASSPVSTRTSTRVLTNTANRPTASAPLGGWPAFVQQREPAPERHVSLRRAGYATGFVGKYLNEYTADPGGTAAAQPRGGASSPRSCARPTTAGTSSTREWTAGAYRACAACRPRPVGHGRREGPGVRRPVPARRALGSSAGTRPVSGRTSSRWRRTRRTTGWAGGAGTAETRCSRRRSATGRTGD